MHHASTTVSWAVRTQADRSNARLQVEGSSTCVMIGSIKIGGPAALRWAVGEVAGLTAALCSAGVTPPLHVRFLPISRRRSLLSGRAAQLSL